MITVAPLTAGAYALVLLAVAAVFVWLQEGREALDARCRWDRKQMERAADQARWEAHAALWEAEMAEASRGDGSTS
jgi:hypothetical protein